MSTPAAQNELISTGGRFARKPARTMDAMITDLTLAADQPVMIA